MPEQTDVTKNSQRGAEQQMSAKKHHGKTILSDYSFSTELENSPYKTEFEKKFKELLDIATKIDPEGRLSLSFVGSKELRLAVNRMISNAIFFKRRYTPKAMMSNVNIPLEVSQLLGIMKTFNDAVDKRKKNDRLTREKFAKDKK